MSSLTMYLKRVLLPAIILIFTVLTGCQHFGREQPNILIAIADDWSWPHAGIAGAPEIQTPAFDRVAEKGVLFTHTFCSAPSCTPSRGALLTGQYHWRLEQGGNLWSTLPEKFIVFPELLDNNGYFVGYTGKGWGPGDPKPGGRSQNPAGKAYQTFKLNSPNGISKNNYTANFRDFLNKKPGKKPFCFWYGAYEPHRVYHYGIGKQQGKDPDRVLVPDCFPDNSVVRNDILDYFVEVEWFDAHLDSMLQYLEKTGRLENTLVIVTSDNGMPFPRSKSNLYDMGTRMPLAIMWGNKIKTGRVINDMVSLTDLAPTILEAAEIPIPEAMTGKSLVNILRSRKEGRVDPKRDFILTGKERHAWVRKGGTGYPMRAIRTHDFLYIRNYKPDRWPAGDPEDPNNNDPSVIYGDIDDSPTKQFLMSHYSDSGIKELFRLGFEKRRSEELFDLSKDPGQLNNLAFDPGYSSIKDSLQKKLLNELKQTGDPRVLEHGDLFDRYPYQNRRFQPDIDPDSLEIYLGQGTMAGEITDSKAILQARLTATEKPIEGDIHGTGGIARFEIARDTGFSKSILTPWQLALPEQDYIIRECISDLQPGTHYFYRLIYGKTATCPKYSDTWNFRTLPGKDSDNPVRLVVVTGMNYNNFYYGRNGDPDHPEVGAFSGPNKNSGYPALEAIGKMKPDYFIGTGDNVYYDHPANEPYQATTLQEMRKKWHEQFSQPRFKELFRNVATYWEIDDHDYRYNDCDNTGEMEPIPALGKYVYLEQLPVIPPGIPDQPTYRTYRFNRYLQVWFLEGRFYRSPNKMEDGPKKSLWGKEQYEWLQKTLLASDAAFKVIISPTPMVGPDDNYKSDNHVNPKGFRHEGDEFFTWLKEKELSPAELFFVCGDRHWQYHAKHQTGFEEFSCGALIDANSRAGRIAGDPESTDPDKKIIQHYIQTKDEASGGFLIIETLKENDYPILLFRFYDENGSKLYESKKHLGH